MVEEVKKLITIIPSNGNVKAGRTAIFYEFIEPSFDTMFPKKLNIKGSAWLGESKPLSPIEAKLYHKFIK